MQNHHPGSVTGSDYTMNVMEQEILPDTNLEKNPLLTEANLINPGSTLVRGDSSFAPFQNMFEEERYRWVVLTIFSLGTAGMGALWGTLIPIASTLQMEQDLTFTYINLYTIVFYAAFIPFNFIFNYVIQEKGLKVAVMIGLSVSSAGAWMRAAFNYSLAAALVGQAIAACVNPIFLNAPSKLAAVWFKPSSRNIATSVAAVSNILGNAVGALIPTLIVKSGSRFKPFQVTLLMMVEAAFMTFVFLLGLILYKDKPAIPPSPAAVTPRLGTWESLKILATSCQFLVLTFSFFCANGALNGITSVIQEIFAHYQYSDPEAYTSLISALLFLIGFIGSFGFAHVADKTKRLKLLLFIANFFAAACLGLFTWFIDLKNKLISGVIICAFGLFNISIIPLSLELGSQITYPVGEANSSGVLMTSSQISGIVLTEVTSALFDSGDDFDKNSAYIANFMNFILSCVGVVSVLLINGKGVSSLAQLKRTEHEIEISSMGGSFVSPRHSVASRRHSIASYRRGSIASPRYTVASQHRPSIKSPTPPSKVQKNAGGK